MTEITFKSYNIEPEQEKITLFFDLDNDPVSIVVLQQEFSVIGSASELRKFLLDRLKSNFPGYFLPSNFLSNLLNKSFMIGSHNITIVDAQFTNNKIVLTFSDGEGYTQTEEFIFRVLLAARQNNNLIKFIKRRLIASRRLGVFPTEMLDNMLNDTWII